MCEEILLIPLAPTHKNVNFERVIITDYLLEGTLEYKYELC